jgi:protein TonB
MDSPWRRLPWTLPSALLFWGVALWVLANFMGKPADRTVDPAPVEVQLVEQSVPQSAPQGRPAVVHEPKARPMVRPQPAPVMPQVSPHTEQNPVAEKAAVTTSAAVAVPAVAMPGGAAHEGRALDGVVTSVNSGARAGSYDGKGASRGNASANSGARAILRPMPQISDDLREEAFKFAALARFRIAANGSVSVELARPTPNLRLNGILLNSLKKWRFIPAIKNGKPVASTEEIVVKMEVR